MRRIAPVTLTVLGLALVPALHAQGWRDSERYGDRRRDEYRDDYRYDDRYPDRGRLERVARIAYEIREISEHISYKYDRNNRRPNRAEARASLGLHQLNEQAARFHADLASYRRDPRQTVAGFRRLEQAFFRAARTLDPIARRPYVDEGMERIYLLMNQVTRSYGRDRDYGHWRAVPRDGSWYDDDWYGDRRYDRRGGRYGDDDWDDGRKDDHDPDDD